MLPVRTSQLGQGLPDPTASPDVDSRQWTIAVGDTLQLERVVPGLRVRRRRRLPERYLQGPAGGARRRSPRKALRGRGQGARRAAPRRWDRSVSSGITAAA